MSFCRCVCVLGIGIWQLKEGIGLQALCPGESPGLCLSLLFCKTVVVTGSIFIDLPGFSE